MIRKLTAPKIQGVCVGLGGKSTKLETIHAQTRPEFRGKLVSVNTEAERTLFLDFLPLQLGKFRDYTVRLHLISVPGQIAQDSTRQMVLRNVDGIALVVDSQANAIEGNNYAIRNLDYNLRQDGTDPDRLPMVVQYNKRDLPGILDVEHLGERLGVPEGIPELVSSARDGWGVFETVKSIVREHSQFKGHVCSARKPTQHLVPRDWISVRTTPRCLNSNVGLTEPQIRTWD